METEQVKKLITKDMVIADIVAANPAVVEPLMDAGVHCVGCGAAGMETLEQGLMGHGKTEEEIDELVINLNEVAEKSQKKKVEVPTNTTINITKEAAAKVQDLMKKQKEDVIGLKISVVAGGCSGFQYGFEFAKEQGKTDKLFESHGTKFFVDPESLAMLNGATIEYVETLEASGFKITNPNAESSCGCGKSFS
jgi:iron-sulfur cluster assembly protein